MAEYRLTRGAYSDLREIGRYTNRAWGRAQRIAYLEELARHFDRIAAHPDIGRSREDIRPGVRSLPLGRHAVFYRVDDDGVAILRILHVSRDPGRHLTVHQAEE